VEREFDTCVARREAGRCFDCGVNTIFDGERCILCGGCADVCPSLCLRLVSLDRLAADQTGENIINNQLGGFPAEEATAIVKDETICIRCGLCAERCPTGAITMERFIFKELPVCRVA
jgi:formate hydrogenlyase subunit 6/NADH:ubiquinone oxidoreductase subunit I